MAEERASRWSDDGDVFCADCWCYVQLIGVDVGPSEKGLAGTDRLGDGRDGRRTGRARW